MRGTEVGGSRTAGTGTVSEEEVCGTDMIEVQTKVGGGEWVGLPEQSLCFRYRRIILIRQRFILG